MAAVQIPAHAFPEWAIRGMVLPLFLLALLLFSSVVAAQEIRLIVRGDDFGMTHGSLAATEKGFREGVLTCASMQVPAPWFEGAVDLSRKNPNWCIGSISPSSGSGSDTGGGQCSRGAGCHPWSMRTASSTRTRRNFGLTSHGFRRSIQS